MLRLPNDTQNLTIIGSNGDGKTIAALAHLATRSIDKKPWIIYDWKHDEHIAKIERAKIVGTDFVPGRRDKGIFIVQPIWDEEDAVIEQMKAIYDRENVGIYVDEGFKITGNPVAEVLMMQGRSKHIPMIVLVQRPVDVSRYIFSESKFYQLFPLGDDRDMDTVENYIPGVRKKLEETGPLPRFHSLYYDKGHKTLSVLQPAPPEWKSLEVIDEKLRTKRVRL